MLAMEQCITLTQLSSSPILGALVLDANVAISIVANEAGAATAHNAILLYVQQGFEMFAPGVIVSEALYVLCGKLQDGTLTFSDYSAAINSFNDIMEDVNPTPDGDRRLVLRAEEIRGSYTCRRSADGVYIALAELLTATRTTFLLSFDEDIKKQAARYAPGVRVELLTP